MGLVGSAAWAAPVVIAMASAAANMAGVDDMIFLR
jgi:hypothetical protein